MVPGIDEERWYNNIVNTKVYTSVGFNTEEAATVHREPDLGTQSEKVKGCIISRDQRTASGG